jgi:hypothetical protein
MKNKIVGACSCNSINFEIDAAAIVKTVNCHCDLCRKMNGSAFSSYVIIKQSGFKLIKGQENITSHQVSPNATKSFCNTCGTPIYNLNSVLCPTLKILYLGTLDNANQIIINANIFCESQLEWTTQIATLASFRQSTNSKQIE